MFRGNARARFSDTQMRIVNLVLLAMTRGCALEALVYSGAKGRFVLSSLCIVFSGNWRRLPDLCCCMKPDGQMILGQSTFEAVLDHVGNERAEAPHLSSAAAWSRVFGLNASFVGASSGLEHSQDSEQLHAAYFDYSSDVVAPPPKPAAPPPKPAVLLPKPAALPPKPALDVSMFKRLSPEDIVKDINLLPSDTRAELQKKRRNFAHINHPDRAPEEWRNAATTRMMLANHLVDDALRKIRLQRS